MNNKSGKQGRRARRVMMALLVVITMASALFVAPEPASAAPEVYGELRGWHTHDGGGYGYERYEDFLGNNGQPSSFSNTSQRRLGVFTGHGPLALFENAKGSAGIYSSFVPSRPTDTVVFNVNWKGSLAASLGADASADVKITISIVEILDPLSESPRRGSTVWSDVLLEKSTRGQLFEREVFEGGGPRQEPIGQTLDVNKSYRIELRLDCDSQVSAAGADTWCDFHWAPHKNSTDNGYGVFLNGWTFPTDLQPACNDFTDVPVGRYYTEAVEWASCQGITNGSSPTTFSPTAVVTRGEMATLLWRYADEPTGQPHSFTDVGSTAYYANAVEWLAASGITAGTSPTTFSPDQPVTRAELATFLWRHRDKPVEGLNFFGWRSFSHSFVDVTPGSYYDRAVAWMASTGITSGTSATTFSPNQLVTRAEAVTLLHRSSETTGVWRS